MFLLVEIGIVTGNLMGLREQGGHALALAFLSVKRGAGLIWGAPLPSLSPFNGIHSVDTQEMPKGILVRPRTSELLDGIIGPWRAKRPS